MAKKSGKKKSSGKSSSQPKFGSPAWNKKYGITPFKKGSKKKRSSKSKKKK